MWNSRWSCYNIKLFFKIDYWEGINSKVASKKSIPFKILCWPLVDSLNHVLKFTNFLHYHHRSSSLVWDSSDSTRRYSISICSMHCNFNKPFQIMGRYRNQGCRALNKLQRENMFDWKHADAIIQQLRSEPKLDSNLLFSSIKCMKYIDVTDRTNKV